jgi:hypothetical protein
MTIIGFTGTRYGMSARAYAEIQRVLIRIPISVAHHGDCVGADRQFHDLVRHYFPRARIVGHPPIATNLRASCTFDEIRDPLPHMKRNAEIVRAAQMLVAAPLEIDEQTHGGTWRMINLARNAGMPLAIVFPDGSTREERDGKVATQPALDAIFD